VKSSITPERNPLKEEEENAIQKPRTTGASTIGSVRRGGKN